MARRYNPNDMARETMDRLVAENAGLLADSEAIKTELAYWRCAFDASLQEIRDLVAENERLRDALKRE